MQSIHFFSDGELNKVLSKSLKGRNKETTKILVIGEDKKNDFSNFGFPIKSSLNFPNNFNDYSLIIFAKSSKQTIMTEYIGLLDFEGTLLAPKTANHISNKELYLISIPKAGTHLLIKLLEEIGLKETPDINPRKGFWTTPFGFKYHAPISKIFENDNYDPVGRKSFLRNPCLFIYRHPLDIAISMLDWYKRPTHAYYDYINKFNNESEQIDSIIRGTNIFNSLDKIISNYSGWIDLPNVLPISYEELVGINGGADKNLQKKIIWSILLRLNIDGYPEKIAKNIYQKNSPTFKVGKTGKFYSRISEDQLKKLTKEEKLKCLDILGYDIKHIFSNNIEKFIKKLITYKSIKEKELLTPRLVQEDFYGHNIIESSGKFYKIKYGLDLSNLNQIREFVNNNEGKHSLEDIKFEIFYTFSQKSNPYYIKDNWHENFKLTFTGNTFNIFDIDKELFIIPHELGDIDPTKFKNKEEFIKHSKLIRPLNQELFSLIEERLGKSFWIKKDMQ